MKNKTGSVQIKQNNLNAVAIEAKYNTFRQNVPQNHSNKLNYSQIQMLNGISSINASKIRTSKNSRKLIKIFSFS